MRINAACAVFATALVVPCAAVADAGHANRQARDGAKKAYSCGAPKKNRAKPPPAPVLTPQAQEVVDEQKPKLAANPDCPEGTVVEPVTFPGPKGSPTLAEKKSGSAGLQTGTSGPQSGAIAQNQLKSASPQRRTSKRSRAQLRRVFQFDNWYWYTVGSQPLPWQQANFALHGLQSNEKPYIQYSNEREHSLSQLWGMDLTPGGVGSTQELGWMVDWRMFGDLEPHLFVYHFDAGVPTGYSEGFIAYTNVIGPGSVVTHNDNFHAYGIQREGSNWWFYYDGYWLGYLPQSAYPRYWNSGFTRIDAGGEMASTNPFTCGDIGSYGPIPGGNPTAAMWQQIYRTRLDNGGSEWAALNPIADDPGQYSLGFFAGSSFRYGGGGYC